MYRSMALYRACELGRVKAVRELLESGFADVNEVFVEKGDTPLCAAIEMGHANVVKLLIERGKVDVNKKRPSDFEPPLCIACTQGHIDVISLLVEKGKARVNEETKDGYTPLYIACKRGLVEAVAILIEKGHADVERCRRFSGETPLFVASQFGHSEVVGILVAKGKAKVDFSANKSLSPLLIACNNHHASTVFTLLQNGADAHYTPPYATDTPLCAAVKSGDISIVSMLLEVGHAQVSFTKNETPLLIASKLGYLEIANYLLKNGANPNGTSEYGTNPIPITPLTYASQLESKELAQTLIAHGADVNYDTFFPSIMPLHAACTCGRLCNVNVLLDSGAEVNAMCTRGTALFIACKHGYAHIVNVLLEKGADINKGDQSSATPLFIACMQGYTDIIRILIDNGADFTIRTEAGQSPFDIAKKSKDTIAILYSPLVSFLCGHHTRCGKESILRYLPKFVLIDIVQMLLKY